MTAECSTMRKKKPLGIISHLSSAACEWFLMFLLFVDAVFLFLLREFAKYCDLQAPCHLCLRLRVLGGKKIGCSWDLMCNSHKEEMSSLLFCSLHDELADFREMCEECLESIGMQNNSQCKLLLGKLWVDVERSSGSRTCSCCNKTRLAAKFNGESLLGLKPVGLGRYKANAVLPLLHVQGCRHFSRQDGMKRLRDKLEASFRQRTRKNSVGKMSRVGYTEFKHSSDSDGDTGSIEDIHTSLEPCSETKDQPDLLDLNDPKTVNLSLSDTMIGCASREISLGESQPKGSLCSTEDVTTLDHVPQPPDDGSLNDSAESSNISSDIIYAVPSPPSTVRITKKSIYIEETCGRVNIEEDTDGTSSDDSTSSSYSHNTTLPGTLCHCAENMKLDKEDMKCMSQASNSEVGLLLKDADPEPHNEHKKFMKDENCSDLAGGTIIDQLRRQIEHDQQIMKSLYEELEEERNATDIAIDQAMSMITKLQEEKAEVEMVAMQYMLQMELRAEHDMESLERDLTEKEKELQDVQTELEFYRNNLNSRNNFCDGSGSPEDLHGETSFLENNAASGTSGDSEYAKFSKENGRCDPMRNSHSLKKLVKNLYKNYCNEKVDCLPNLDSLFVLEHNGSSESKGTKLHDWLEELETCSNSIKYSSNLPQIGEDRLQ